MKQTFNIPDDCNATVEQVSNQIVVPFEPKVKEFKKGDIVSSIDTRSFNFIAIVESIKDNGVIEYFAFLSLKYNYLKIPNQAKIGIGFKCEFKVATPEQRQLLFSKLEENGYRYNEKTCELEMIKWVPKEGEKYCFINSYGFIQEEIHTWRTPLCTNSDLINCFKPNSLDQENVTKLFAEFIQNVKDEHGIDY